MENWQIWAPLSYYTSFNQVSFFPHYSISSWNLEGILLLLLPPHIVGSEYGEAEWRSRHHGLTPNSLTSSNLGWIRAERWEESSLIRWEIALNLTQLFKTQGNSEICTGLCTTEGKLLLDTLFTTLLLKGWSSRL